MVAILGKAENSTRIMPIKVGLTTFLIYTGASINMMPVKYAKYGTEPYSGALKMWNEVEDKPTCICRMKVSNPRNGKKYSVPFLFLMVAVCLY